MLNTAPLSGDTNRGVGTSDTAVGKLTVNGDAVAKGGASVIAIALKGVGVAVARTGASVMAIALKGVGVAVARTGASVMAIALKGVGVAVAGRLSNGISSPAGMMWSVNWL